MRFNLNSYFTEEAFNSEASLIDPSKTFQSADIIIGSFRSIGTCPIPDFSMENDSSVLSLVFTLVGYINSSGSSGAICSGGNCTVPIFSNSATYAPGSLLFFDNAGLNLLLTGFYGFSILQNTLPIYQINSLSGLVNGLVSVNCSGGGLLTVNSASCLVINNGFGTTNPTLFSVTSSVWNWNNIGTNPSGIFVSPPATTIYGKSGMSMTESFNPLSPITRLFRVVVSPGTKCQVFMKRGDGSVSNSWFLLVELQDYQSGNVNIDLRGGDKLLFQSVRQNYLSSNGPLEIF